MKKLTPVGCLPLPQGYIHVYGNHYHFQISFSLKPLGQSKPNFMWSLLWKGEKVYIKGPGHMTKMAATPIYDKNLQKSFSRTFRCSPMIMKLGMKHYELKLYTVYINDDQVDLDLFYNNFKCCETCFFCTHSRLRYQVSIYR